jgi:hypothetical protein
VFGDDVRELHRQVAAMMWLLSSTCVAPADIPLSNCKSDIVFHIMMYCSVTAAELAVLLASAAAQPRTAVKYSNRHT